MYLIAENTDYELPLAVADTLSSLAKLCNTDESTVCRIIRDHRTTRLFNGIPAKIYKILEQDEEE